MTNETETSAPALGPERAQAGRQLPLGAEIFLDHVGFFVRDVEAASRALRRAGFAPTPPSIQVNPDPNGGTPRLTGTGNITAMLSQGYIEVLFKTADTPLAAELEVATARYRRPSSRGVCHCGCRRGPSPARAAGLSRAAVGQDGAAGGQQRRAGNGCLHRGASGAGGDAGRPHPDAHPSYREHGLAAPLALAPERRVGIDAHRDCSCRSGGSGAAVCDLYRSQPLRFPIRTDHRARSRLCRSRHPRGLSTHAARDIVCPVFLLWALARSGCGRSPGWPTC